MSKSDEQTEIFHRINKLKVKAGLSSMPGESGVIASEDIKNAQELIDKKEEEYPLEIKEVLTKLQESWERYKSEGGEGDSLEKIYNYSNNIKDLTSMYQHDLMTHFSLSLREFCEKIDLNKKEHQVIVQAHINVMWVTYEEKLRSDKSEKAEELKKIVDIAIKKYS